MRAIPYRTLSPCLIMLNHPITSRALSFLLLMCHGRMGQRGGITEGRQASFAEQTTLLTVPLLEALLDDGEVKQRGSPERRAPSRRPAAERAGATRVTAPPMDHFAPPRHCSAEYSTNYTALSSPTQQELLQLQITLPQHSRNKHTQVQN